tara:strand:- start:5243 stop:7633 length:2391 start_codon:yes stop_codon:yes gene_type:complete
MSAEAELEQIKQILSQIRDQGTVTAGTGSQSSQDLDQYTRELKLARQELDLLDKNSASYNRKLKEVEALTRQTRNALKDQRRETDLLSISMSGLSAGLDMLGNAVDKVIVKFAGLISGIMDEAKKLDTLTVEFQRTTGASAALASNIGALTDRLRLYGVTSEEAAQAVKSLQSGFIEFTRLNKQQQFSVGQTVALMNELGISFEQSAKIMEIGTRGLGMSLEETQGLLVDMRGAARALEIPLEQLTADFLNAEDRIIGMGKNGVKEFMNMQAAAKATGVSTGKLIDIAGKFDSITDAQRAAQRLNAMLGGGFFDSRTLNRLADSPTELAEYIREGMESAGMSMESLTGKNRRLGKEFAATFGTDLPTTIKLLTGDITELEEQVEKSTYTLEEMKKEAFGLKGFDEVVNNAFDAFKRPVSDIQQAGRATFEGLVGSGIIGRFEKFNAGLIEQTSAFVNKNQKLIGGISMLYNVANIDGVQKGYEIFKGIATFTGTMVSNMFSLKGLLAIMVGGALYSISDQFGEIKKVFSKDGIMAGVTKTFDVLKAKFMELRQDLIDKGFDQDFFNKGIDVLKRLGIEGYRKMNLHFFGPIRDYFSFDFIDDVKDAFGMAYDWAKNAFINMMKGLVNSAIASIFDSFAGALDPLVDVGLFGIGDKAKTIQDSIRGTSEGMQLDVMDDTRENRERSRRLAARRAEIDRIAATNVFMETKGAKKIESVIEQKVAPKVTSAIDATLGAGSTLYDTMKDAAKAGIVEGTEIAREANAGVDASLARRAGDVNLDRRKVGDVLLAPVLTGRR